ncbi:MAG: rubrerythrin family protein [Alistipes shahii]
MKLRLVLILLLFAASVGILVWLYCAATRAPRAPQGSPWTETLADLDACCRRKHVKSVQYDKPAAIAVGESRPDAERLCPGPWLSPERLQEHHCAQAILHPGRQLHASGPDRPLRRHDRRQPGAETSSTNSGVSASGTVRRSTARCGKTTAMRPARLLAWAAAADRRNAALLEHCRRTGKDHPDSCRFLVCPGCGNIYAAGDPDPYCPFCLTRSERFVRFE